MDRKIVVEGGVPLRGSVDVSGAKNAALPVIAAALLAEGDHVVRNVPDLADVRTLGRLLGLMGCAVERSAGDARRLDPRARRRSGRRRPTSS